MKTLALILMLALTGCASQLAKVEEAGGQGLDALEGASALGVKACFRYLGSTARVGPLLEVLPTSEKRGAWLVLFGNESVPLPE